MVYSEITGYGGIQAFFIIAMVLSAFYIDNIFEKSDERIEQLAEQYREGSLLSGELKELAAERIVEFLEDHQERRATLGSLEEEVSAYRLTETERQTARRRAGYPQNALLQQ